jgi:aspartate ammonia-lyase
MVKNSSRTERDLIGEVELPADALHGIHTARAMENFPLAGRPVHVELVRAYGQVKLACALTNRTFGAWANDPASFRAEREPAPT